jgi:hypothetical protein
MTYRKPIKCWLFGHKPVQFLLPDKRKIAGCLRELAILDPESEYSTKFPEEFWKNQNPVVSAKQSCLVCGGYGWDADWGGPHRCSACWGTGKKLLEVSVTVEDGHLVPLGDPK